MKKIIPVLLLVSATHSWAQEPPQVIEKPQTTEPQTVEESGNFDPVPPPVEPVERQEPEIFAYVEEPAEFPGGMQALKKYLADNIVYPKTALEKGIEGRVYLKFIVSETGEISNVQLLRGIPDCPECNAEAIRVVKAMPKWKPGRQAGKAVKMWYNLPIAFKIPVEQNKQ